MGQYETTSGADLYAKVREQGRVTLRYDDLGGIPTARRLAKADGFILTTDRGSRGRGNFRMTDHQARTRPTEVCLTRDGREIVFDANKES